MAHRVLLIEDEEAILELFSILLSQRKYMVDCAHDAREAETFLTRNQYSAVISDLSFDGGTMEGLAIVEKLATQKTKPTVVVCSGFATREVEMQALSLGADLFVAKPFAIRSVVEKLDFLLTRNPEGPNNRSGKQDSQATRMTLGFQSAETA